MNLDTKLNPWMDKQNPIVLVFSELIPSPGQSSTEYFIFWPVASTSPFFSLKSWTTLHRGIILFVQEFVVKPQFDC